MGGGGGPDARGCPKARGPKARGPLILLTGGGGAKLAIEFDWTGVFLFGGGGGGGRPWLGVGGRASRTDLLP